MNYGNPHQNGPTSFLPPLGNRGMGRERKEPVKMYPGGPPRSDKMYPGGPPRNPQMRPMMEKFEPFIGSPSKRFSNPGPAINNSMVQPLGDQASYSPENRVYDDFIINDLINQGTILPSEVYDMGEDGYKQIRPRLMGQELQGPLAYG